MLLIKNQVTRISNFARIITICLLLGCLLNILVGETSFLETQRIDFENYTVEHGLIHNSANCFAQDKEGFLWIGSNGGLERFDGYSFTIYKPKKEDLKSLSGTAVWAIYVDHENNLWIGTLEGGLNKYNRELDNFISFHHDEKDTNSLSNSNISCIFEDLSGNFWVTTRGGGINLLNKKTGKFRRFKHEADNPYSIGNNLVHTYCIDGEGNIWLGTESGISILDPKTFLFRDYYKKPGDLIKISSTPCLSLLSKQNNEIWIGTWLKGLFRFNLNTLQILNYVNKNDDPYSLPGDIIWDICEDSFNRIWLGTNIGLCRYLDAFDNFTRYVSDPSDPKSLSDNFVRTIFEDMRGVLWIGTDKGGINKLDLYRKKFQHYYYLKEKPHGLCCNTVTAICDDYKDRIWIGTCDGLNLFNRQTGYFSCFIYKPGKISSVSINDINAIVKGAQPYLWIALDMGISRFNTETHEFIIFKHDPNNQNSLTNNAVSGLYYDREGALWIGSWGGGLDKYEPDKGSFTNYVIDKENPVRNVVLCILEDNFQNLYLGTYSHGLVKFNKNNKQLKYYEADLYDSEKLKGNVVQYLHQRNDSEIWVCTGGGGLSVFNPQSEKFKTFDIKDGLPSSDIISILEDNEKNLWISTSKGLSKLEINNISPRYSFINFDYKDGLQSNMFSKGACLKSKNGEMYFGGLNGFNIFYYDSIRSNPFTPNVIITNFEVLNKSVKIGEKVNGRVLLSKSITETKEIVLTHKEYIISIEFAALHFAAPFKNKYQYMLEGFERDWINTDANRRFVTYSNLEPGDYIFRVKASNNDGKWSDKDTTLKIIVNRPWWGTWWFRISIIFLFCMALAFFFLIRIRNLKTQGLYLKQKIKESINELTKANIELKDRQDEITSQNDELANHRSHLEHLIEERTRDLERALIKAESSDKLKSSFLANMSHEIRTPMNAIVGFSSLLKDFTLSDDERYHYIDIINKNCDSLLILINDILDISKIEANQINIYKTNFNVDNVLIELERFFKMRASKNLEIKYIRTIENVVIENDAVRFRQVFSNLLTNALKFTESGHIHFGFEKINANLRFYVSDTGIGIERQEFNNIFNPFTKVEFGRTKLYRGAGLGLSISKNLVEKMGGIIWIESVFGEGSIFYFTVPHNPKITTNADSDEIEKNFISSDLSNNHILIAEDEPANYLYLEKALKPTNASIHWAKNGLEAVDMVKNAGDFKFDLILMDIKMPVLNGIDAFIEIRKIDKYVPIIAQSAFAQEIDRQQAIQIGFADYLTKPIKPKDLIEVIQKHI